MILGGYTKKLALAVAAACLFFSGSASAADLAARPYTKAPPVVAAVYDWSGIYVGGAVGGIWNTTDGNFNRSVSAKADAVMGRIRFKFNPWPTTPVVAKY